MSNKRDAERAELHRTIWQIANELRGSVDGWDFKQYVLGILFYRYISENLTNYVNKIQTEAGDKNFDYKNISDKEADNARDILIEEKGFFIYPSKLFCNITANCDADNDLNITLGKIFASIEDSALGTPSERDLKGLFDDVDVDSKKLGATVEERNKKLRSLLKSIAKMNLGNFSDNSIDAFGDAYEYLMTMYAADAGKSGGEFFTPQEVSELIAELALIDYNSPDKKKKKSVRRVYDPACGSGSLLLKCAKFLGRENVTQGYYGQEINLTTYNLARINMFLHDINFEKFYIAHGDTLTDPKHWDEQPFDVIVSNPPYSLKWESDSNPLLINDPRYSPAGVLAPKGAADYAFIMHMLSWLSSDGTAAIVESPGILFRAGAEGKIRQYLVDNNYIDTIITLPGNLFFGTNIVTCILVIRKNKKDNGILFVDASDYCDKSGKKAKLRNEENENNDINKILELVKTRKDNGTTSIYASYDEIVKKEYNLSMNSYKAVQKEEKVLRSSFEILSDLKELDEEYNEAKKELSELL